METSSAMQDFYYFLGETWGNWCLMKMDYDTKTKKTEIFLTTLVSCSSPKQNNKKSAFAVYNPKFKYIS